METDFPADSGDWLSIIAIVIIHLVFIGAAWPNLFDDEGENE
jgi:hypothetical protein